MNPFKRKSKELPKREPLNPDSTYLANLIEETEQELLKFRVTESVYQQEVADPKQISKTKAEEYLTQIQKRIRYQQEQIEIYWQFAENRNIKL